jgi:hypothetical protein
LPLATGAGVRGTSGLRTTPKLPSRPDTSTRKPMPMRSIAAPITTANMPTEEAKNEVLSAVPSAVSLIHTWRAGLLTGWPVFGSLAASAATLVPLPSAVANCGIWA